MTPGVWLASKSEEDFSGCGDEYATKEEAIALGGGELCLDPGESFYVGQVVACTAVFDADDVVEQIGQRLFDQCGEASDCYQPTISAEADAEFDVFLDAWLRKNGLHPEDSCFAVENVESVEAPAEVASP